MVQNTQDVDVEFLFWDFTWPLWLIVLASSTLGALVMLGVGIVRRHRRRKERRAKTVAIDAASAGQECDERLRYALGTSRSPELRSSVSIGALDRLRTTFRYKTDGLDEDGLRTRIGASSLTSARCSNTSPL